MKSMTGRSPQVSIVLPTYNRSFYLEKSIGSVLSQSFSKWELIIVDDGSEDDTISVCSEFVKGDKRIKLLAHAHCGLSLSLNAGLLQANAPYITFLNSDDEYLENHLLERYNYLEAHKEVDLLHGGIEVVGDPFVVDYYDRSKTIDIHECYLGPTIFSKREVFIKLDGFVEMPAFEDTDFMLRAEKEYQIERFNVPTYRYYRDTPESITNTLLADQSG